MNTIEYIKSLIRDVPDFPKPGIMFKDITPLLADPKGFQIACDTLVHQFSDEDIDGVVGIESRGFIFGASLATRLNTAFIPVRKPGKLPAAVDRVSYTLEYGSGQLEMHKNNIKPGSKVVIVDDLLATGGSAVAARNLVLMQGGEVHAFAFIIELMELDGRNKLNSTPVISVLKYP